MAKLQVFAGVVLASLAGAPASAAPTREGRFREIAVEAPAAPAFVPWALRGDSITLLLVMAGDSVATARANAPAPLSHAERHGIARGLEAAQEGLAEQVRAHGGEVLGKYQHAVNGIKVRVPVREAAKFMALPGVVAVRPVGKIRPDAARADNAVGVPFVGAPDVWGGASGFRGERIKVAVIDTGIDYTHADFGGPGTAAAYTAAHANETLPADPTLFGPGAPKVKGGIDLVGDAYDAGAEDAKGNPDLARRTPHPDPNPLDCNGHGSHVAGTAVGFGVTAAGATYRGPYTADTVKNGSWRIGPGVAPLADLYAVRVFGCEGSTDVTVDAIDWAVANDMDVINMSLGSAFGTADDAAALAAENAARAGIQVVASAGNGGHAPYITGAPAAGDRVISVAAVDVAFPELPLVQVTLASGANILAQNSNGATLPSGTLDVVVLRTAAGAVSLGCSEAEYVDATIAGKLVVTLRGTCARVDRAIFGQKHGAAAVAMINNAAGYPAFEAEIPGVTIPFLGVLASNAAALTGSATASLSAAGILPNPGYDLFASFTSGGPRHGDSALKPTVTAPGVSVNSVDVGSGNGATRLSGTSMAAPHVAGVAALAVQAHPRWRPEEVRAAIVGTTDSTKVRDYEARLGGAGVVQAAAAVSTQVVALAQPHGPLNLSFGFAELERDFRGSDTFRLRNRGRSAATFDVAANPTGGSPHTVEVSPARVRVGAGDEAAVHVRLTVPVATAGNSDDFRDVAGLVTLTPAPGSNGGVALTVPYYLVPRARSEVESRVDHAFGASTPSVTATVRNREGAIDGTADFYAWGLSGVRNRALGAVNLRAAGVQAWDDSRGRKTLVFALNSFARTNNAAVNEYDVLVDTNGDGKPDFLVLGIDQGLLTAGDPNGQLVSAVINLATGDLVSIRFLAGAPTDGSTVLLPARASDLGITAANPRFSYRVETFSFETGASDGTVDAGKFNAFASAISTGDFAVVPVGGSAAVPLAIDAAEWARTPPKGIMVVNLDDEAGHEQADLVPATAP